MRTKNDGKGRMGGRAKGTPNKTTATIRDWVQNLIDGNRQQIEADLKQLQPKERVTTLVKLLDYVIPRMQSVSAKIDFNELTDAQIDAIINHMTEDLDDEDSY